mmetsp:Transcript_5556/g.17547  ORF Transcript_5556/g.17547 Transcript_5556/m.17547 type:complete len:216 (+) Transcript_5556:402-1049(+)
MTRIWPAQRRFNKKGSGRDTVERRRTRGERWGYSAEDHGLVSKAATSIGTTTVMRTPKNDSAKSALTTTSAFAPAYLRANQRNCRKGEESSESSKWTRKKCAIFREQLSGHSTIEMTWCATIVRRSDVERGSQSQKWASSQKKKPTVTDVSRRAAAAPTGDTNSRGSDANHATSHVWRQRSESPRRAARAPQPAKTACAIASTFILKCLCSSSRK